jgi:hypothetical protein
VLSFSYTWSACLNLLQGKSNPSRAYLLWLLLESKSNRKYFFWFSWGLHSRTLLELSSTYPCSKTCYLQVANFYSVKHIPRKSYLFIFSHRSNSFL